METETKPASAPHIYQAMVAIARELATKGIAKDRRNEQQNFVFRSVDQFMNVAGPIIAQHNVVFLPSYFQDHPSTEHVTAKGTTLYKTTLRGEFLFVSAVDGSYVTVTSPGEAMDSGDKAMNKAKAAALKYLLMHVFLVPTEGTEDADATTPEPSVPKPPNGFEEWFAAIDETGKDGFEAIREAWKSSPEDFRTYAMSFRKDEWDAAKKRATAVTQAAKKAAEAAEKPAKATK